MLEAELRSESVWTSWPSGLRSCAVTGWPAGSGAPSMSVTTLTCSVSPGRQTPRSPKM